MRSLAVAGSSAAALLFVAGCLPDDNRPPPGSVQVLVQGTDEFLEPLSTSDGWTIHVARLLVGLGTVELHGERCNIYGQAHYSRLFDFTEPLEADQKLGLVHGLGTCSVEFRLRAPHVDAVLGPGVEQADVEDMRIEVLEKWSEEPQRTSVWVVGEATAADGTRKTFDWMFRRRYSFKDCEPGPEGQAASALEIEGGETLTHTVLVDGSQLFRPGITAETPLSFEPFALADVDGDGSIAFAELETVTLALLPDTGPDGGTSKLLERTLASLLLDTRLPLLARLAGAGPCNAELDGRRW